MPTAWEDRRALFQRGKEVHEPGRRLSGSSGGGVMEAVRRASTSSTDGNSLADKPLSSGPASPASDSRERRRSSAASKDKFANLHQHKRGSEDYATRRQSYSEQLTSGGVVAGWFNKTFRGVTKPTDEANMQKRGVME